MSKEQLSAFLEAAKTDLEFLAKLKSASAIEALVARGNYCEQGRFAHVSGTESS